MAGKQLSHIYEKYLTHKSKLDTKVLNQQSQHWEKNFSNKPEMFGLEASKPAKKSLKIFQENNFKTIVELGSGLGRDSIFFSINNFIVNSLDYSPSGINIINKKISEKNLKNIYTKVFDIRQKLPFEDSSIDACFSHMLYCMALTNRDLLNLNNEIKRILKPDGINIYTARNEYDGDYKKGIHRGENMYEIDGFIIHFFNKEKVISLTEGFKNIKIESFEEGSFPRKLYFVVNKKII